MMRTTLSILLVLAVTVLAGCGGTTGVYTSAEYKQLNAPNWFYDAQDNMGSQLQATATAQSSRVGTALDKARMRAKRDLASEVSTAVEEQRKTSVSEASQYGSEGTNRQTVEHTGTIRTMTASDLYGVSTTEKAVVETERGYRAFVLLELDETNLDGLERTRPQS